MVYRSGQKETLNVPGGSVGGGGDRDPVVFRVVTASYRHGLDACTVCYIFDSILKNKKTTEPMLVEALRYKSEGCGFEYRWCHWNFLLI
jgi:hypothetical protein